MIEYKLYITNPMFYGSSQNNFEKNLSGKITINETIAASGMTERMVKHLCSHHQKYWRQKWLP